jgi:hypothetical protein
VHANLRANFLASPPLVVAFALAGTVNIDLSSEPLGTGSDGRPVFLKDIWPADAEVAALLKFAANAENFRREYADLSGIPELWDAVPGGKGPGVRVGSPIDLYQGAAVLRWLHSPAGQDRRRHRRAGASHLRQFDHDRPHQPGIAHQAGNAGGGHGSRRTEPLPRTSAISERGAAITRS